jgi:hypothetical protein
MFRFAMPLRRAGIVRQRALPLDQFGASDPSLRHAVPGQLVLGTRREFRHELALGSKSEESIRHVHWPTSALHRICDEANAELFGWFRPDLNKF